MTLICNKKCKVDTQGVTMTLDCSDSIVDENKWPGDTNWELTSASTAGWPADATSTTPEIEGFASGTSVNAGGSIDLYVDVRTGNNKNYKIEIYRMGWYNGVGARKMAWTDNGTSVNSLTRTSVQPQPVPSVDDDDGGVVDCLATWANGKIQSPWTLSNAGYTLNVPSWWLTGVYLAKLTEVTSGRQNFIIFVVREDGRGSDLLVQSSFATWTAYNPWGGNSLYPYPIAGGTCGDDCWLCYGKKVSFNRPYAQPICYGNQSYGAGAGEFIAANPGPGWEYNALRWFEKQGYDTTYCTSVDTHTGDALLNKSVKAFVSVGHDEYWSSEARSNVETGRDRTPNPINVIFLSSNTCYWRVHYVSGLRSFSCEKSGNADLWRAGTQNNPEVSLIGVEYIFNSIYYYSPGGNDLTLTHPSGGHWAFDFTGISAGGSQALSGLLGYEVDGYWEGGWCGDGFGIPSTAPGSSTIKLGNSPFTTGTCTTGHSYVTIYTAASGAQVFATGSMDWNYGLDDYGYYSKGHFPSSYVNSTARQFTHNVIRKLTGNPTAQLP